MEQILLNTLHMLRWNHMTTMLTIARDLIFADAYVLASTSTSDPLNGWSAPNKDGRIPAHNGEMFPERLHRTTPRPGVTSPYSSSVSNNHTFCEPVSGSIGRPECTGPRFGPYLRCCTTSGSDSAPIGRCASSASWPDLSLHTGARDYLWRSLRADLHTRACRQG
jgi:hypothetical protein